MDGGTVPLSSLICKPRYAATEMNAAPALDFIYRLTNKIFMFISF